MGRGTEGEGAIAVFTPVQRAVLAYVDSMTQTIEVPDGICNEFARHFDAQQLLEVTVLAGAYNMHTRVTRALRPDVEQAAQKDGK